MHFITDAIIAVLTLYLSFTNTLATNINEFFFQKADPLEPSLIKTEEPISSLPSRISQTMPDILLRSAAYQQAALSGAASPSGATTHDPLEAIVNIFCTFTTDEYIRTTTGTGFFIDPNGIIITNAHVAQFLLIAEANWLGNTECIVRSGNPATPQYLVELLYLPPAWIQENAKTMHENIPMGTGERDYALLYVRERIDQSPLPAFFPALALNSNLLPVSTKNTSVIAAGYPATQLLEHGPNVDLRPQKATTSVSELYTFGSNYADVFSIRGSAVGAEGASGGPVINEQGEAIGMIVTRGDDVADGAGSLRAITISHIARTISEETGFSLEDNLGGNLPYRAQVFAETLTPFLVTILEQNKN